MVNRTKIFLGVLVLLGIGGYMKQKDIADIGAKLNKKWLNLNPEMKTRALMVLEKAENVFKDTPYTLHIFDGWRTIERQKSYMKLGTSFVANPLSSYHPWGLAVDFVFKDARNNWTWEPGKDCEFYDFTCHGSDWYWGQLGKIIESVGLEWGGRWKNFDGPHAQLTEFGNTRDLIAEYGSPENFEIV